MRFKAVALLGIEIGLLGFALCGIEILRILPASIRSIDALNLARQAFVPIFCLAISFYYNDLYNLRVVRSFTDFCAQLPQALGMSFILLAAISTISPSVRFDGMSSMSSVRALLIVISLVVPIRAICYGVLRSRTFAERVLILGTSSLAQKLVEEIEATPYAGYSIVGLVDGRSNTSPGITSLLSYPLLGPLERLEGIITELHPDRIIVALAERRGRLPVRDLLNARMNGVIVEDGVEVHERFTGKLAIESLNPSFLFFSKDFMTSPLQMTLRRVASLTFSVVGLVVTAPLMVLIAAAIKVDSSGPVFFIQERAGLRGKPFRLVKFRTMHPIQSAEEGDGSVWDRNSNARITRVGKWLRKLRLDELPQFINILRGDMDLVGPRPEMANNVSTMIEQIPYYSLRMVVRPGLTGWAQVKHGYSVSQEDVTEKMRYDLYYVKHMSLWFDLKILVDTVKIVLLGHGSEQRLLVKEERFPPLRGETAEVPVVYEENSQERRRA